MQNSHPVHTAVVQLLNASELCEVLYGSIDRVLESKADSEDDCNTLS